ncbi:MAG: diguanylate cyclase [Halioglobus sp.]|nr:diguanylate cyclase [Halioglobus sp.]
MKFRISPTVRVSFGLIMLTLSILFVGDWLGLIPREETLEMEQRKKLSESLAVQFSSLAQSGELGHIRTTLEALVSRNEDIVSAAFRSLVGDQTIEAGDHLANWQLGDNGRYSTYNQVVVPIFRGEKRWGSVEIRFREQNAPWYSFISNSSFTTLVLFIALSGFFLYLVFLRRVLRHLDPSQVVPERVKAAFDSLAEGVLILDEDGHIVLSNTSFASRASTGSSSMVGTNVNDLDWNAYQSDKSITAGELPWSRVMRNGEKETGHRLTLHRGAGGERSFNVNCTPIHDDKNNIRGVISTFDDITELERHNETLNQTLSELKQTQAEVNLKNLELQQLATRDPLTNCLNRRAFNEQYSLLFEQAKTDGSALVCIMVDIDHFKRINDTYGHGVGDKVIRFVAEVLRKQIRRDDLLGRYGGEEFCVVLAGSSIDQAQVAAERMRKEITSGNPSLFTAALRVTASLGIASIEQEPASGDELVNRADKALYLAKESGRNKVMVWGDEAGLVEGVQTTGDGEKKKPVAGTPLHENDVVDSKERIRQLEQIALEQAEQFDRYVAHDPLTQLPVRNLFIDRVEQALLRAKREGQVLAVLSLRLQNLRRIYDTLGYESGEELLRVAAQRLLQVLRCSDTISLLAPAGEESTLSRLNEGEFGLLLPAVKDSESITWIVKRVFEALREPLYVDDHTITLTGNVGIGVHPTDGSDAITLIKHAGVSRFYAEQRPGSNHVEYYSEQINRVSREQLLLESEMSAAIDNGDFEVLYQPKIALKTGQITGFEALLRWNHATRGQLTPNEFINIAERTRLINLIGDWVLRTACLTAVELSKLCSRSLSMAVNLSPVQFSQGDLPGRISAIVRETGLRPEQLELELTESCLMENPDTTFESLMKLQSSGISISIDDFGTGYSGLNYLRTLPISSLKIDRCFVADISAREHDKTIVTAIVGMARALELTVIAEGVETREQMDILAGMDCHEAQGYLFSRPVSAAKARRLLLGTERLDNAV